MNNDIAQSDPVEGSREVIERELERQDQRQEVQKKREAEQKRTESAPPKQAKEPN
jgi:hypothetical protein